MSTSMEEGGCGAFARARKIPRWENGVREGNDSAKDLISHLPDECIFQIFSFLPSLKDRCSCSAVSKKWLVLQANMRATATISALQKKGNKTSRCLEGKKANDTRLAAIAVGSCPFDGLQELCIRGSFSSQGITDSGLEIIAQACRNLKSLVLWDCLKVRDNGLITISQRCNSIQKVEVFNCPSVSDEGLISVARNCRNILSLSIDSCPNIGNPSLQAFATYSSGLRSVSFSKCQLVNSEGLLSVFSSLRDLEVVKLVSLGIEDCVLQAIGKSGKSLKSLFMESISGISENGFSSLGRMEKLETLSLKSCSGLSDMSLREMGIGLVQLKQVEISNCGSITATGMKELSRSAPLLESLKLQSCHNVSSNGLMEIVNCTEKLKILSLVKCNGLQDRDPSVYRSSPLPKCPLLQSLTLSRCSGVGDSFLAWLASPSIDIRHLQLVGLPAFTDRGLLLLLRALRNQTRNLLTVNLSGCLQLTDASILIIVSYFGEKLRSLRLDGCKGLTDWVLHIIAELCPSLVDLDLSGSEISDDGILSLVKSKHQKLEVLSLAGCSRITDKSLAFIQIMCASLVGLNIKNCSGLSKTGVNSLRETLWWCDLLS